MQKYEIMVIIPNTQDAKTAEATYKGLNKRLNADFGATVTFEDFWGERGFAYRINKQTWGYYGVSQFDMEPAKATELRHELNLDPNVVRFLVTKVEKNAPAPQKYADMQAQYAAQSKKKEDAPKPAAGKKAKLTTVKETPAAAPAKAAAPAEKKDAVDKKLDAIIDESSTDL